MLNLIEDPAANHVREMAKHFDAELDESNDASTISMDNYKAKGFISSYRLFKGLTVWVYNIIFHSEFKVDLVLSPDGPIYFCYNTKGYFLHRFGKKEAFAKVLQNQNMIVIGSPENSVQITFPKNIKLELAVIIVDIKLLKRLDIRNAKRMSLKVQKIFHKIPKDQPYRFLGDIDAETGKYASIVCENKSTDLVGGLLTEGAVLNMLASQIEGYERDNSGNGVPPLSKSDLSKISTLGAYVIDNLEAKMTILNLSRHFGLSPKKLQVGIKHLYGDSVGQYILNLRMGHAKYLFMTTDLNVSETCNRIGISSHSYFSKLFKSRFGVLPSKFRNK